MYVCMHVCMNVYRPSHFKITGGPKMARAALSRRTIDGPNVSKLTVIYRPAGPTPVCRLSFRRATYGPYRLQLDGPFRRAKNGPSQMRRPECIQLCMYVCFQIIMTSEFRQIT